MERLQLKLQIQTRAQGLHPITDAVDEALREHGAKGPGPDDTVIEQGVESFATRPTVSAPQSQMPFENEMGGFRRAKSLHFRLGMRSQIWHQFKVASLSFLIATPVFATQNGAQMAINQIPDGKLKTKLCTIVSPEQLRQPQKAMGLTRDQLLSLARTSYEDEKWVRWYVGGDAKFADLGKNNSPLIVNGKRLQSWASCDAMKQFIAIANHELFMAPKMICTAGNLSYTLRTAGDHVELELGQLRPDFASMPRIGIPVARPGVPGSLPTAAPPRGGVAAGSSPPLIAHVIERESVQIANTDDDSCPLKITPTVSDTRGLQICLQKQFNGDGHDGTIQMSIAGRPLDAAHQTLSCRNENAFLQRAQNLSPSTYVGVSSAEESIPHRLAR